MCSVSLGNIPHVSRDCLLTGDSVTLLKILTCIFLFLLCPSTHWLVHLLFPHIPSCDSRKEKEKSPLTRVFNSLDTLGTERAQIRNILEETSM